MPESSLVSVVVPCFNYARFLDECVQSVIAQSYRNWECLIIDDGSMDETPDIGRRLAVANERVRYIRQANAGLSAARNRAVSEARGSYLQFLDADDRLEHDKLRVQVEYLERHPDIDLVVGGAAYFTGRPPYKVRPWPKSLDVCQEASALEALLRQNQFPVNAALLRASVIRSVGNFDVLLRSHEDWDLWLRCALQGHRFGFVYQGADRALIRQHESNMSSRGGILGRTSRETMGRTEIEVRERVHCLLPEPLQAYNAMRLAEAKWTFGVDLMRSGKMTEGWRCYREGWSAAPRKARAVLGLLLLLPGAPLAVRAHRRLWRTGQ